MANSTQKYAQALEQVLLDEIDQALRGCTADPVSARYLEKLRALQVKMVAFVASNTDSGGPFQGNPEKLAEIEQCLQVGEYPTVNAHASSRPADLTAPAIVIVLAKTWNVVLLCDRLAQYYRQLAANTPESQVRILLSSLAEIKSIMKRRAEGPVRRWTSFMWGEIGFAPFQLNKDD